MSVSSTATPVVASTITLPGLASFDRQHGPSRANSHERERRHFRPYPESNTRTAQHDDRPRKRPAPDQDPDGDVGMQSDREQDGDDESSGSDTVPVKQEQESDTAQSPSPPPTPAGRRYTHPQPQFAPTPPASARRVSPPHMALPTLAHHASTSHVTLPPLHLPPPEPAPYSEQHMSARKRRRVTISGVAGNHGVPPRPLHRTVLERAGSGYAPPTATTPATPTLSGMVSPVVTPGFNLNSPGAISQVRDTIAIRMEQKALIEQRKNGGVAVNVPQPRPAPAQPVQPTSPAGQATAPAQPEPAPTTLSTPPAPTQTLAHRRGRASNKLTIHTPNTSISQGVGNTSSLGLTGTDPPPQAARHGLMIEAVRSAPPGVTRFDPASLRRPGPPQPPPHRPPPPAPAPAQHKERSVPIRRMHANSSAAPPAPLAIVAPGQPLILNAPAPPSSYIATPTRTQFPPATQTPHHGPHRHGHMTPRTAHPYRPPTSPPISRDMFMAFYDAYAEVHSLRARLDAVEKDVERRVELAVREMREEIRLLREEVKRHEHRDREPHGRDWDHRKAPLRSGSMSVSQSPMQLDKRPLPPIGEKGETLFVGRLPGPGDRLPPSTGERVPGPGERYPTERAHERPGPSAGPSSGAGPSNERAGAIGSERLHPHPPRSALRKSPSGRVPSSRSPPSRQPSVETTRRVRTKSPPTGGNKSG